MRQAATSTISLDHLLNGRSRRQGLEQLDQIWSASDFKHHLANLVTAQDFFAMSFTKPQHPEGLYLPFEIALFHRDGNVVNKFDPGYRLQIFLDTAHLLAFPKKTAPRSRSLPILGT